MKTILDYIAVLLIRAIIWLLNSIPLHARLRIVTAVAKLVALLKPSFRAVSMKNLKIVFPDKDASFHEAVYQKSFDNLARIFVDFARMHTLTREWIENHVSCPFLPEFQKLKASANGQGVLVVTGHLGSFELMAHTIGMLGHPVSFIVRNFPLANLDAWWTKNREQSGNAVISRQGAVKEVFRLLLEGKDVALLFDQNIKRKHAVFVPWFGMPAATTMTVGIVSVRLQTRIVVSSMHYLGNDTYEIDARECNCDDIYADAALSQDEKAVAVTSRVTSIFEKMVLRSPEGWFWMHRRWKTRPEGEPENVY